MKVLEIQPMIQSNRTEPSDYTPKAFMDFMNQGNDKNLYGLTTPLLTTSSGAKMGKTAAGGAGSLTAPSMRTRPNSS